MENGVERITRDPSVMIGKPCIRGMRVTVGMIVGQFAGGRTHEELLNDFPYLEREDVTQALRFAALLASGEISLNEAWSRSPGARELDERFASRTSTSSPHR